MGVCDLVPGISGGTIAFVTGIYSRLIGSVKNISPYLLVLGIKFIFFPTQANQEKIKRAVSRINLKFLLILFFGIGFSLFAFSKIINFLLTGYFAHTTSFFIGLIFASSKLIMDRIEKNKRSHYLFAVLGFIAGLSFLCLGTFSFQPSYFYLFFGGFLAVNAMFLPGISGAFILLVLGLYEFMIKALADFYNNLKVLFIFILGALLGAFTISRLVAFFLKKKKNKTLLFLFGLVLGSLGVPVKRVSEVMPDLSRQSFIMAAGFFLFGVFTFAFFNYLKKKKEVFWQKKTTEQVKH